MHPRISGSSLVSSSHLVEATWENALGHFRRALLECGSAFDVEHSQRIGLLFSKRVGDTEELKRWASIFDAEDVPTTALLLKALVNHKQWQTAMQLLELNKDAGATKELSEVLAQSLTKFGLWQQTLSLISTLTSHSDAIKKKSTAVTKAESSLSTGDGEDDSFQMATNPAFLPAEERSSYCGFVTAVAQGYPRKNQWKEAVATITQLKAIADADTQVRLYEYEVARLVHDGEQYDDVIARSSTESLFRTSPSLLRSLVHCAIAKEDGSLCFQYLELLCAHGSTAISSKMFERACVLFVSSEKNYERDELLRFERVVCRHASYIQARDAQILVSVFCADYDLKIPTFISGVEKSGAAGGTLSASTAANSVTQLDRVASTLMSQNRWKEALQVAEQIIQQTGQSDSERIIVNMLRSTSGSWQQTLEFFSA